jgi:MarR family 2-MHQ and catechol resistance regulon transcriptional repressor
MKTTLTDLPFRSPPPTDPPTATALKLFVVLNRAIESVRRHALSSIASRDLTETEFAILEALYHKGPLLLGEVQKKILVSSGGVTFLIDKLEKRGLVRRAPCASDRRARYAELTDAGRALIAEIFPAHAEVIRRAMSGLGLADQRALTALLKTLGTEAEALEAKPGG